MIELNHQIPMQYKYILWGKVRKGKKRGRTLEFPTANVALHKKIPSGIYISRTKINTILYPSLTFIGNAKQFDEKLYQAEVFFLTMNKNIYGQWLTTYLLKKIRNNQKFASVEDLKKQMEKDKEKAEKYFLKTSY